MKFLEGLLTAILAVFAPVKMILIITILLIFVDLVTGIIAAHKKGQKISSAGLRRTTTKTAIYLTAICMGFLVEKYMLEDYLALSKIIAGLISIVELKSLLENLDVINGSPLFKSLIKKLGSVNDDIKEDVKDKVLGQDDNN